MKFSFVKEPGVHLLFLSCRQNFVHLKQCIQRVSHVPKEIMYVGKIEII